jgi:integrase
MAILAECPLCHKKQATRNKRCRSCGLDLDKAKGSKKVKYWINYRLPDSGKQVRKYVGSFEGMNGYSIENARVAYAKRLVQKREGRILDMLPETKMTFQELTNWYLDLEKIKALAYFDTLSHRLKKFNANFGDVLVCDVKPADLENHQAKRKSGGHADSTVDEEIGAARTMVSRAFDNGLVGAEPLTVFRRVKKLLKRNSNARDRILSPQEFEALKKHCAPHVRMIVTLGYYTGMRLGEILSLTWAKVDLTHRFIRLEPEDTKDRESRLVPIMDEVYTELVALPHRITGAGADSHVFLYKGKPIASIKKALKRACERAKIPYGRFTPGGFIFHDLRHTYNTNMRKAGVRQSVIMKITGHSTREMFDRYNTVDPDDARQAVDQLKVFFRNVDQTVDQEAVCGN